MATDDEAQAGPCKVCALVLCDHHMMIRSLDLCLGQIDNGAEEMGGLIYLPGDFAEARSEALWTRDKLIELYGDYVGGPARRAGDLGRR